MGEYRWGVKKIREFTKFPADDGLRCAYRSQHFIFSIKAMLTHECIRSIPPSFAESIAITNNNALVKPSSL